MKKSSPSAVDIQTAIDVLLRLDARIHLHAIHSMVQLPSTKLGNHYAKQLENRAMDQTLPIKNVCAQLDNWRSELGDQRPAFFNILAWTGNSKLVSFFKKFWSGLQNWAAEKPLSEAQVMGKMLPKNQW